MRQISNNQTSSVKSCYLFCYSINDSLQVSSRNHRKGPCIDNSQVLRAPYPQVWIDYSTLGNGQHGTCATRVELCSYTVVDHLTESILVRVDWRNKLSRLQFYHRWRGKNLTIKEKCFDENLPVHRVTKPSRVYQGRLERIGRVDVACSSRKRVHDRYCQATGVVVDNLISG